MLKGFFCNYLLFRCEESGKLLQTVLVYINLFSCQSVAVNLLYCTLQRLIKLVIIKDGTRCRFIIFESLAL